MKKDERSGPIKIGQIMITPSNRCFYVERDYLAHSMPDELHFVNKCFEPKSDTSPEMWNKLVKQVSRYSQLKYTRGFSKNVGHRFQDLHEQLLRRSIITHEWTDRVRVDPYSHQNIGRYVLKTGSPPADILDTHY